MCFTSIKIETKMETRIIKEDKDEKQNCMAGSELLNGGSITAGVLCPGRKTNTNANSDADSDANSNTNSNTNRREGDGEAQFEEAGWNGS